MKFFNSKTLAVACALLSVIPDATASVADEFPIKAPDAGENTIVGALMPYTRYDSHEAALGGGAVLESSPTVDPSKIASQASDRSYVSLPSSGAYAEWTVSTPGDGVTMRFTMPDTSNGRGQNGSLDIYVNGSKVKTVDLTSFFMWQYFNFGGGDPADEPGREIGAFAFDETHFILPRALKSGDKIRVQSSGANGLVYGVDFIELETVPEEISQPSGAVNVCDYGAVPDDGRDDLAAFRAALSAADRGSKVLYIPAGTFHLSGMWNVYCSDIKITGAGIWHTNLKFTSEEVGGGGISGGNGSNGGQDDYCNNVEFCHMYINSSLRSRHHEQAVYKCFMDVWRQGSVIHDIWEEHFECGFWFGDYNGATAYCDGVKVINCRIRNNLADGVNFCQGTSNATVYNCSVRNNGDDGLAIWNNSDRGAKDASGNTFAYNTIDLIWRAGAIAIYGGDGHKIYNNYIRDTFMAAGIHLNSTFPGYRYQNTRSITFDNNYLVGCGTARDCWNEDLAAIDIKQEVKNVTFNNTRIYDSPAYAIRTLQDPSNIVFNDTRIFGAGLAGNDITFSCVAHSAAAIRHQNTNTTFNGVTIANVAHDTKGNNTTWPVWTDNNRQLADAIGYDYIADAAYDVPGYPGADQNGDIHNVLDGIYDYNVTVARVAWSAADGRTDLREGDAVTFTALVHNDSDVDIPEGAVIGLRVVIDGKTTLTNASFKDGLAAGSTVKLSPVSSWLATAGGHSFDVTVDYNDKLPDETDETDNTATRRFNVLAADTPEPTFTPVSGGMDLTVIDLGIRNLSRSDEKIYPGDRLVFSATIANAGDCPIPSGQKIGVQFYIDNENWGTGYITWNDLHYDGLASHATIKLEANGGGGQNYSENRNWLAALDGVHTVTAWVDDQNLFAEVNKDNNRLTKTLNIPYEGINYFTDVDKPEILDLTPTEIDAVLEDTDTTDDAWYTLTGLRLAERPTAPGFYIHQGKKFFIR